MSNPKKTNSEPEQPKTSQEDAMREAVRLYEKHRDWNLAAASCYHLSSLLSKKGKRVEAIEFSDKGVLHRRRMVSERQRQVDDLQAALDATLATDETAHRLATENRDAALLQLADEEKRLAEALYLRGSLLDG